MAYTNAPFSLTSPAGSANASTIDDEIRKLRLDVQERLDDLVSDFINDDPIVTLASVQKTIHWSTGVHAYSGTTFVNRYGPIDLALTGSAYVHPGTTSTLMNWLIPLWIIPVGATLTDVVARVYRDAGASLSFGVNSVDDTPSVTSIGTATSASTGYHDLSITGLSEVITAVKSYWAHFSMISDGSNANSARLVHVTVEYDLDHALQGLGL